MGDYLRSVEDLEELVTWVIIQKEVPKGRRFEAVLDILRRLPEDGLLQLDRMVDEYYWFVPHPGVGGQVYPFPASKIVSDLGEVEIVPIAKVLYLSPTLENRAIDVVIANIVHELAHIYLEHEIFGDLDYHSQENDVFEQICDWGFG